MQTTIERHHLCHYAAGAAATPVNHLRVLYHRVRCAFDIWPSQLSLREVSDWLHLQAGVSKDITFVDPWPTLLGRNAHLKLLNLPHESNECLVNVYSLLCRSLNERTSQSVSQRPALCWRTSSVEAQDDCGPRLIRTTCGDLSLVFQIAFGADNNHGKRLPVLHTKNLFVKLGQLLKRTMRVYGIYEKKSFAVAHVMFSHCAICRAVRSF